MERIVGVLRLTKIAKPQLLQLQAERPARKGSGVIALYPLQRKQK